MYSVTIDRNSALECSCCPRDAEIEVEAECDGDSRELPLCRECAENIKRGLVDSLEALALLEGT